MKKTLVVVGNAPPREDRSAFIDHCDVVVRFNLFRRTQNWPSNLDLILVWAAYPNGGEVAAASL
jgi:hypothetical protein